MLARLARRLSRERGWGAHLAALEWRQRTLLDGEIAGLRQAAGLSTGSGGSGSGANGKRRGGSKPKGSPKVRPPAAFDTEGARPPSKPAHPASAQQLDALLHRFKVHARGNDAARAEQFFRSYIQAGGAPLHWMLPMLLGTYGRLRQADKAWAIYRQLVPDPQQQQQQQQGRASSAAASNAGGTGADAAAATAPSAAGGRSGGLAPERQAAEATEAEHHAWEGRLAARQQQLEQAAAQLARDLRLDALPLDEYGYGALLTALSRAEHPPYDLPVHYAEKAAQAFEEMQAAGVKPNVVLWHNLLDCQAKACQPDAAFATYRRMLAAGASPNSWTFSMLISACGRARQPARAAEVVERLMPQAGVAPSLTVWNSLLGAYGRAGSVDAAYAAWLRMLESGTTPDDCTERSLALAFGSHPALAAEVVAEARHIRQQREAQGAAEAAAAADGAEEQGGGGGGEGEGEAGAAGSGSSGKRPPYRLHQHRQTALAVDQTDHVSRRSQRRNPALGLLLSRGLPGSGAAASAAGACAAGGASDGSAAAAGGGEEAEGQGLQLRQLLLLDLHGSSQAAARMVLLRRLEALVMHAPELLAEMERLEREHYRDLEWQQQLSQARRQKERASRALMRELRGGGGSASGGGSGSGSDSDSGSSSGSRGRSRSKSKAAPDGQQEEGPQQRQQLGQQEAQQQLEWPALGQRWAGAAGSASPAEQQAAGTEEEAVEQQRQGQQQQQQQQQEQAEARPRGPRFAPPPLNIITGVGRHSKGGGVLKAAVQQVLQQQGLPARDDPTNEGVVIVPWPALAAYLERQREAMDKDHFFTAARVRYLYVLSGVAGLAAAANLLPRLAPWLPS